MTRWAFALTLAALMGGTLTGCAAAPITPQPAVAPAPSASAGSPRSAAAPAPASPPAAAGDAGSPAPAEGSIFPADEEIAALDDDDEDGAVFQPTAASSPLLQLSDGEIDHRFHHEPASLGSASVGRPGAGALWNGVQMPRSERWTLLDPGRAYGTQETVDALTRIIDRVNERLPGAHPLAIGHLSAPRGGHLSPHVSHQAGRDADVGYYYKDGARAFVRATEHNLDLARTWALLKAAVKETPVEMILVDRSIQKLLSDHAAASGEDRDFLDQVLQIRGKNARAVIRHIKGHANHIHFRWHNPNAEAMGQRVARFVTVPKAPAAVAAASPGAHAEAAGFAQIKARSGDTLVILARRYGCTVEEIQRLNGLNGNAIRAGNTYKIPQKTPVKPAPPVKAAKGPGKPATPATPATKVVAQRKPASSSQRGKQGAKPATSAPER